MASKASNMLLAAMLIEQMCGEDGCGEYMKMALDDFMKEMKPKAQEDENDD